MSNHLILSVPISMCLEVLHHDHSNKVVDAYPIPVFSRDRWTSE